MGRSSSDGSENLIVVGIFATLAVVALLVWKFSTAFGLDMATGGRVLSGMAILAILTAVLVKLDFELIGFLPVIVAALWMCWWPALNYWAAQAQFPLPIDFYPDAEDARPALWWAAWYTKLGGVLLILGIGYGVRGWLRR